MITNQQVVLAALLHDIGKFRQRSVRGMALDDESNRDRFCPESFHGHNRTHAHAAHSFEAMMANMPPPPGWSDAEWTETAELAASHHLDSRRDIASTSIRMGDRLASGMERVEDEGGDYQTSRLLSIFSEVYPGEAEREEHHLRPFSPTSVLPSKDPEGDYGELWNMFVADARRLGQTRDVAFYTSRLMNLLMRYTWCIPSSTYKSTIDISLFDHVRATAALAQALFLYQREHGLTMTAGTLANPETKPFILIKGDISGIQSYVLSDIKGRKSTQLFRARSFYLQLLMKSAVLVLCRRLGLMTVANIVDTAGHTLLIVPNIPAVKEQLDSLRRELDQEYSRRFNGVLSLSFASMAVSDQALRKESLVDTLDRLEQMVDVAKFRKFRTTLVNDSGCVIEHSKIHYSTYGVCDLCARHPASRTMQTDDDFKSAVCECCGKQVELIGARLNREKALYLTVDERVADSFLPLGVDIQWQRPEGPCHPYSLACDGDYELFPVAGYWPAGMTFQDIATPLDSEGEKCAVGLEALAIVKGDVDNLGTVFSRGLVPHTLTRFTALSRMFDTFFSIYLPHYFTKRYPRAYIVYAGGDDLLMLGNWRTMMVATAEIRKSFSEFTSRNKKVTLSAGLLFSDPHNPLFRTVHDTEDLLRRSKDRKAEDGKSVKDAITLVSRTVSWQDYHRQLTLADDIERMLLDQDCPVSTAFLYRVFNYARMMYRTKTGSTRSTRDFLHGSLFNYDLSRNVVKKEGETIVNHQLVSFWMNILANKEDLLLNYPIAFHRVIYAQRNRHQ